MQSRITELESQLTIKEEEITKLIEQNVSLISKAKNGENTVNEQTQELELKITNLQRQLE